MAQYDVIVVGGGIIGTSCAYWLAKRGHKVLVMDQVSIPNPQGSSDDHARIFRLAHGKDSFYVDLAQKTLPLWEQLQTDLRMELLTQHGMLQLAQGTGKYETETFKCLQELKIRGVEKLKPKDVCERYRMMKPKACKFAVFHPQGGIVWAKKAIEMFSKGVEKHSGKLESGVRIVKVNRSKGAIQGLKDSRGRVWRAENYVFAAGAWTKDVLSDWGIPLSVTRQEALYLRPPRNQGRYRPAHFPVFSIEAKGYHGFPVHIHGFMKVGFHKKGPVKRTPTVPVSPDKKFEKNVRSLMKGFIPDLTDFTDMEGRVYYYTRTPDNDFIIDRLPAVGNGWVAAGFSGDGPMFSPLVGQVVSQMVSGEKPEINLHRFRIGRLKLRIKK